MRQICWIDCYYIVFVPSSSLVIHYSSAATVKLWHLPQFFYQHQMSGVLNGYKDQRLFLSAELCKNQVSCSPIKRTPCVELRYQNLLFNHCSSCSCSVPCWQEILALFHLFPSVYILLWLRLIVTLPILRGNIISSSWLPNKT